MAKRFCVIGLGNFGLHVAKTLYEEGHEVVAIDMNSAKAQKVKDHVSYAIVCDAANMDFLKEQGIGEMDAVVVSTGEHSHRATLIALFLNELRTQRILVKAVDEDHGRILEKVGATDIIYPEKDMAIKIAHGLASPNILDFIPVSSEDTIIEAAPPQDFIGKSIMDLDLRRQHEVTIIGIKDVLTDRFIAVPPASHIVKDSELLILVGKSENVGEILQKK